MDGIPAYDSWDLIVAVLGNTYQSNQERRDPFMNKCEVRSTPHTIQKRILSQGVINDMDHVDFIPSNVNSSHQEAFLYVFEDEAVIKMIIKGRSPTMRHVSRTHRVALDWLFDRIDLDPKIQIKYICHHLLCLFNISLLSSTVCSETMAKRLQQDSGEDRVTAKSRPMMSFIARVPSNVSSSTSVSSAIAEKEDRLVRPVVGSDQKTASDYYHEQFIESFSSASYAKWDDNHAWSSQAWKTDTDGCERSERPDVTSWRATRKSQLGFSQEETQHDGTTQSVVSEVIPRERSGRPDVEPQREARPQQFVIGNDEAELELSVESRSFVNWVNDQVRKRQKRISNVTGDGEEHSMIWGMFMSITLESAVFMGKNYQNNCHSIANTTDLTRKQINVRHINKIGV